MMPRSRFCFLSRPLSIFQHHAPTLLRRRLLSSTGAVGSSAEPPQLHAKNKLANGIQIIENNQPVEEETLPGYKAEHFYPVRLGQVFDSRFKVVAKLGYGSSSTIWLTRDLQDDQYIASKVYVHDLHVQRELSFYKHLERAVSSEHIGANRIRRLHGHFDIDGPHGRHIVLALQVSQMSVGDLAVVFTEGNSFSEGFVKGATTELLKALDFMHTAALDFMHTATQCVHTDVHPGNLLLGTEDNLILKDFEEIELRDPVRRKRVDDRDIYLSRVLRPKAGPLLLSDFGETRLGEGPHAGDIMPIMYRAPEVLLRIKWSYPVDIWSAGLTAWDLLEGRSLFSAKKKDGSFSDGAHLAELIAALGPPPADLLSRHKDRSSEYWRNDGTWGDFVPIPNERTLEAKERKLEDKTKFLRFIRRALTWDPNARPTARELLQDPWLLE